VLDESTQRLSETFKDMKTQTNDISNDPEGLELNKALFWDVQTDTMDIEIHSRFIIERVVSRGNMTDWNLLKKIYGKEKIRAEVVRIRSLDRKTLSFLSAYFGIEQKDFRCCS
jgi:hypothetical protein